MHITMTSETEDIIVIVHVDDTVRVTISKIDYYKLIMKMRV